MDGGGGGGGGSGGGPWKSESETERRLGRVSVSEEFMSGRKNKIIRADAHRPKDRMVITNNESMTIIDNNNKIIRKIIYQN